jgi:hypothetical protein
MCGQRCQAAPGGRSPRPYGVADRGREMELNGARSNPRAGVDLYRLGALHDELLRRASTNPHEPRPAPVKVSPVLETVTMVLERAGKPMRACEIHAAACELAGEPLLWTSVKAALAAGASGRSPRLDRVGHGVYQSAGLDRAGDETTTASIPPNWDRARVPFFKQRLLARNSSERTFPVSTSTSFGMPARPSSGCQQNRERSTNSW